MTDEDRNTIQTMLDAAVQSITTATHAEAAATETVTDGKLATLEATIRAAKSETIEAMHDMQTEILRGIEAFARGNFARMHRLETSSAATVEQLAALEERVLRLETRQQFPPQ